MVEGARNLSREKATEPENNSKMCTGLQQLNLKAAEKLLGCYEQKSVVPEYNPSDTLCSLQKVVRPWPNKHNLITLQIKVSYLSPDFK